MGSVQGLVLVNNVNIVCNILFLIFIQVLYSKKYGRRQDRLRKSLFIRTHKMILSHNSKESLFKMDHNKFSVMVLMCSFCFFN